MKHLEQHPDADKTVLIKNPQEPSGEPVEFVVEDWYDRVTGRSWTEAKGNPAAMIYGFRAGMAGLPTDDEVVYGKLGWQGMLVHVSEILPS
jgi:hypothetical protein